MVTKIKLPQHFGLMDSDKNGRIFYFLIDKVYGCIYNDENKTKNKDVDRDSKVRSTLQRVGKDENPQAERTRKSPLSCRLNGTCILVGCAGLGRYPVI